MLPLVVRLLNGDDMGRAGSTSLLLIWATLLVTEALGVVLVPQNHA